MWCQMGAIQSPSLDLPQLSAMLKKSVSFSEPGVNFINIIRTNFSYECRFFYVHVTRENNVRTKNLYV